MMDLTKIVGRIQHFCVQTVLSPRPGEMAKEARSLLAQGISRFVLNHHAEIETTRTAGAEEHRLGLCVLTESEARALFAWVEAAAGELANLPHTLTRKELLEAVGWGKRPG